MDGANATFTVQQSGTYEIEYAIHLTASLLVSTRVIKKGVEISDSVSSPPTSTDSFTKRLTVTLAAGDTISLQLYGLLGAVTLSIDPTKITSLRITKQ